MNDGAQNTKNGFVGQVLLAMPAMTDPRFERSVIYICAHNEDGAMGIVINKTLNSIDFRDLLEELDIPTDPTTRNITVHFGGPVENQRGFVLHSLDYEHAELLVVEGQVGLSATLDILRDLAQGTELWVLFAQDVVGTRSYWGDNVSLFLRASKLAKF